MLRLIMETIKLLNPLSVWEDFVDEFNLDNNNDDEDDDDNNEDDK